jgi:hypothetical protein
VSKRGGRRPVSAILGRPPKRRGDRCQSRSTARAIRRSSSKDLPRSTRLLDGLRHDGLKRGADLLALEDRQSCACARDSKLDRRRKPNRVESRQVLSRRRGGRRERNTQFEFCSAFPACSAPPRENPLSLESAGLGHARGPRQSSVRRDHPYRENADLLAMENNRPAAVRPRKALAARPAASGTRNLDAPSSRTRFTSKGATADSFAVSSARAIFGKTHF